jgi:hypothetical protein
MMHNVLENVNMALFVENIYKNLLYTFFLEIVEIFYNM